ncbi:MAG: nucleoside-diphosphate-sugar epimerase [Bradymonadia bacterium]|jgi:nucleoside-diphosphate-sugar epimerase
MSSSSNSSASNRLIVCGLGYTGSAIDSAWRSAPERTTLATVRSYEAATSMEEAGRIMVRADFSMEGVPLLADLEATAGVITFGTSEQPAPDATVTRALAWLAAAGCETVVYLSSTSVYGNSDGGIVTELTEPAPASEMGRLRIATETAFRAVSERLGLRHSILRLPGIYGPDRTPRARLMSGAYRFPEGLRWSNRIYRDDVAQAVLHVINGGHSGTFNVSDGAPFQANAFAHWCASELGVPTPAAVAFDELTERAKPFWLANRRVDNQKLRETGWSPMVPNYQEGHRLAWRTEDERMAVD